MSPASLAREGVVTVRGLASGFAQTVDIRAHRLMAEMTSCRLLERTPAGLYRPGPTLRMIGSGAGRVVSGGPERVGTAWRKSVPGLVAELRESGEVTHGV